MNISITAEKVSINLSNTAPALAAGVISSLSIQQQGELEWSETLCNGERVDYAAAEKAVAKLGDGWRLPTRQELESLLDLSRHEPAIDTEKYPDTKSTYYWTSSKCAWNEEARWVVHFHDGSVNGLLQSYYACVRAVRASEYQCNETVSLRQLHDAWLKARSGKKPSSNQFAFDTNWASNLLHLQQRVNDCTWQPLPSTCFIAIRPKAREIHAPDFSDRVVHHWLVPQLEKMWEPAFIFDSYANRKGKGSHAAVARVQQFVRQVPNTCYLQLDIHNFFNSIHRPTLWAMLKNKLVKAGASQQVMHATHALLKQHPLHQGANYRCSAAERAAVPMHKRLENSAAGCGLPIGNLSSQFFANVHLDALDQFVKHHLKAKRYIRYVDDFVIFHPCKEQLAAWQTQIEQFIADKLQLKLKQDIRLQPISNGLDFLGYVVRPTHTLTRQRVVSHFNDALSAWECGHVANQKIKATPESLRQIRSVVASYMGHIKQASSQRLIRKLLNRYPWLPAVTATRKFDYRLENTLVSINTGSLK